MSRRYTMIRFPRFERREISDDIFALAGRRTEYLGAIALSEPLYSLLASAYLQGLEDAVHVIEKNGLPAPADAPPIDPRNYGFR